MARRMKKIVEAETTPVVAAQEEQAPQQGFDMSNVAEMVMVGRYKSGEEFVVPVNFDDVLKARMYCDYGIRYFDLLIDKHLIDKMGVKK